MVPRDWEKRLTAAERKALKALDNKIAALSDQVSILRMRRTKIQNRASARAKK